MSVDTPTASTDPLNAHVGAELRRLRSFSRLSQKQACEAVFGTATLQGMWSRWERGIVRPNVGTLQKIAMHFGVPMASFGVAEAHHAISDIDLAEVKELLERALALHQRALEILTTKGAL